MHIIAQVIAASALAIDATITADTSADPCEYGAMQLQRRRRDEELATKFIQRRSHMSAQALEAAGERHLM